MKITINKIKDKKLFIDECYGILQIYKKLLVNNNRKIKRKSTILINNSIFILIYFIVVLLLSILEKQIVYYICLGVSIAAILIFITKYIIYNKFLNNYESKEINSVLEINDKNITLENKINKVKYLVEWVDIKKILITEHVIVFMSEFDKTRLNNIIMISRDYEDEIFKILDKYNKKDLIIYSKS